MNKYVVAQLTAGETVTIHPRGSSMEPLIKSGQEVILEPVRGRLEVDDIVLARVNGQLYLHKVLAVDGQRVQIGNNKGHVNGWTSAFRVYGRVTASTFTPPGVQP